MGEESDCFDLFVGDDLFFDFDVSLLSDSPVENDFTGSSPDSMNPWIEQIEGMLMNDDDDGNLQLCQDPDQKLVSDFLSDIIVDSPDCFSGSVDLAAAKDSAVPVTDSPTDGPGSGSGLSNNEADVSHDSGNESLGKEKAGVSADKNSVGSSDYANEGSENENLDEPEARDDFEDDTIAKKKRRQLRNRDAAVRSRERKKSYLKDLETKSKYLERECMRLGRLLQCFVAENQALHLCLQKGGKAYDALRTKQESAVLLLESLLLGSLLWYLWGVICQYPRPHLESRLPSQATVVEVSDQENVGQRGRGSKTTLSTFPKGKCGDKSRRCKGSRTRMKVVTESVGIYIY